MLYIRGHKIIKGYIGNTPVSHVGFGKSGLIKIKSENGGSDYPNNLIAKYTTNTSGVLPVFNDGYQYTVNETESNGICTVELYSDTDFTSCSFNGKTQLLTVEYLKVTSSVADLNRAFYGCSSLTSLDVSNWDTSNVTNMRNIFNSCDNLTSVDVSNWDTSKVTTMRGMFYDCDKLTSLDVSNWNTSNVADMYAIFQNCANLTTLDVSNFDTSNVTNMSCIFYSCDKLTSLDVGNWDTSKVTNTSNMFTNCTSLNEIIATNVSASTLSTLITALPTKTSDSYGTIRAINTTNEITASANAKYWNIDIPMLIARYTANASGVVPTFNKDSY